MAAVPLGLIYDVHGNLPALEAVLGDAGTIGVESWILGGDYALFGPWPAECVERLQSLPEATWIRGNCERHTAARDLAPDNPVVQAALEASLAELGDETTHELAALSDQATVGGIRFCHGSPVSDELSFLPEPTEGEEDLLAGVDEQLVVFGHTHLPFRRRAESGIELVNPGSVGMPFDGDTRAAWAVIHPDGAIEHRRVAYDHDKTAAASRERHPGFGDTIARRIESARFDV
jgi:diadenosine tetraphosphatase ApaH/serine/threonine PP2A family protein phosphatase